MAQAPSPVFMSELTGPYLDKLGRKLKVKKFYRFDP